MELQGGLHEIAAVDHLYDGTWNLRGCRFDSLMNGVCTIDVIYFRKGGNGDNSGEERHALLRMQTSPNQRLLKHGVHLMKPNTLMTLPKVLPVYI